MSPLDTKKLAGALLGVTSLMIGVAAQATVLTFEGDFITDNEFSFTYDYGDRVTALKQNGFEYGLGAGFTPNITVEYIIEAFDNFVAGGNFGDLINVLSTSDNGGLGEVRLVPDPGYSVALHGFDVAPWFSSQLSQVRVLDADDNVLFDSGLFTAILANGHYHFPGAPIVSSSALRIINTFEDFDGTLYGFRFLALDNVSFSQSPSPVPVPAALPLFLSALAGMGLMRRTRR